MTGRELIKWIQDNNAEDLEVFCEYDPWCGDLDEPSPEIKEKSNADGISMPDKYLKLC